VIDDVKEWLVDYGEVDVSNFELLIKKHIEQNSAENNPTDKF
jgi:hypothetical protein